MQHRFKAICELALDCDGDVQATFIQRADMDNAKSREQRAVFNVQIAFALLEGKPYWITIEPAFPH